MSVQAFVQPAHVGVGDPFQYVVVARGSRVSATPGPFEQLRGASVHRSGDTVRIAQTLVCVDRGCAPDDAARRVLLPAPIVDGMRGRPVAVTVVPRVPAKAVEASRAVYREQTAIPASTAPLGLAGVVLLVVAATLVLAALALLLGRRVRLGVQRPPHGLGDALALLRESADRPVADRRRASDLVARLAGSDEATRVAWAPPPPQPEDVRELADHVEGAA